MQLRVEMLWHLPVSFFQLEMKSSPGVELTRCLRVLVFCGLTLAAKGISIEVFASSQRLRRVNLRDSVGQFRHSWQMH